MYNFKIGLYFLKSCDDFYQPNTQKSVDYV